MISLHYSYYILGVIILALGLAWYKSTFAVQPEPLRTEKQLQGKHFRQLQWHGFWSSNFFFAVGLTAVGSLIVYLPTEKYNLIREIVGGVITLIMTAWREYLVYIREAGSSSARKIEYGKEDMEGK